MKDARTRELDENKRAYDEDLKNIQETYEAGVKAAQGNKEKLLAVENEKNQALKLAQIRYERTRLEIIDRYNDEVYEKQKSELDREYNLLEKQLERNRRLYDTTSLREPKQANYQTKFNQNPLPLGLGRNWLSVYQSKDDVERQYKDQVKYNNDYLELTKKRINGENALLDQEIKTLSEKMTSSSQSASVQAPEAMNTAPINYSRNLLGDKELDNINQPLKCYVLESDITNAQTKVRVTEQNATF